jgi:anti-sigma regulatory factor (Ser/Thr protein kinase)
MPLRAPRTSSIPIETRTDGLVASAVAADLLRLLGVDRDAQQRVALAAGEIGTNVFKHGGGGRVEIRCDGDVIEVWGFDRGARPGTVDPTGLFGGWGLEVIARAMDTLQSGRDEGGGSWVRSTLRVGGDR